MRWLELATACCSAWPLTARYGDHKVPESEGKYRTRSLETVWTL